MRKGVYFNMKIGYWGPKNPKVGILGILLTIKIILYNFVFIFYK